MTAVDIQALAMDMQEAFLICYGWIIFWSLVAFLVASIGLVVLLPFLNIRE